MLGERRNHENIVEFWRQFLKKLRKILMVANIFLLLVMHPYQSINKDAIDVFKEHGIVKWFYYAFEALYAAAHLIVSMDLISRPTFRYARTMFGTLGVEMILLMLVSYRAWFFINVAILNVALLWSLGLEFLRIQPTTTPTFDDGSILEVPFNLPKSDPIENGLDGNDFL